MSKATENKPTETPGFEQQGVAVEISKIVGIVENQDQVRSPVGFNKKTSVAKNKISYDKMESIEAKRLSESPKGLMKESHSMETAKFL